MRKSKCENIQREEWRNRVEEASQEQRDEMLTDLIKTTLEPSLSLVSSSLLMIPFLLMSLTHSYTESSKHSLFPSPSSSLLSRWLSFPFFLFCLLDNFSLRDSFSREKSCSSSAEKHNSTCNCIRSSSRMSSCLVTSSHFREHSDLHPSLSKRWMDGERHEKWERREINWRYTRSPVCLQVKTRLETIFL